MTDEYGSDSQPAQEHEHETPEQEPAAHDAEAGVWTDDQPPHDDFGGGTEEMATVSQEAATDGEADETAAPEARNSRSMLPIFAGIGGIVLLGAVIYWQFGRSPQTPPPMPALAASTRAPASPAALPPTAMPPTSASTDLAETDINALYKPTAGSSPAAVPSSEAMETPPPAAVAAPSPVPPETIATPPSPTTAMATIPEATMRSAIGTPPAGIAPSPQLQAGQANPVPPMPGRFHAPSVNASAVTPVTPSVPSPNANVGGNDPQQAVRINALTARIEELQKSLEQENKQLSQVSNMVAANQVPVAAPTSHASANPDLENRLNRIEQTLLKLENDESSKVSPSSAVETSHAAVKTHSSRTASTKHIYTHKKWKTVHRKPSPSRPSYEMVDSGGSSWVLRAATPKEAWISAGPTSPELRHVQVGDTLVGIGTVRTIRQSGGGWEIEGTTGVVR